MLLIAPHRSERVNTKQGKGRRQCLLFVYLSMGISKWMAFVFIGDLKMAGICLLLGDLKVARVLKFDRVLCSITRISLSLY